MNNKHKEGILNYTMKPVMSKKELEQYMNSRLDFFKEIVKNPKSVEPFKRLSGEEYRCYTAVFGGLIKRYPEDDSILRAISYLPIGKKKEFRKLLEKNNYSEIMGDFKLISKYLCDEVRDTIIC